MIPGQNAYDLVSSFIGTKPPQRSNFILHLIKDVFCIPGDLKKYIMKYLKSRNI